MEQDRREFLRTAAIGVIAAAGAARGTQHMDGPVGIASLKLKVAARDAEAMRRFYRETMGLAVDEAGAGLVVRAGGTRIEFEAVGDGERRGDGATDTGLTQGRQTGGTPYYHFAFNIPENKFAAGKRWLKGRCELLKRPDGSDEYHFVSWNAHSVYFNDPAGNILEFIARHNLRNAAEGEFSPADILYASEIALVVDDVGAAVQDAAKGLGMEVFAGSTSEQFAAVGDDHRLLIIVKRGREWNSGHGRTAEVFPLRAEIAGSGRLNSRELGFEVLGV